MLTGTHDLPATQKGAHINDLSDRLQESALALLVTWIGRANHSDHTVSSHHFAVTTHLLDGSSHFHRKLL